MFLSQRLVNRTSALWRSLALSALFLAIIAARLLYIAEVNLHGDELWSIWQGFGSISDLIRWNPYDWPPLYFILLDFWVEIVGLHPLALRYLSVLFFLIGSAFLYRVIREEADENAAVLVILILGGFAFVKFLSTELRGYSVMLMILPMIWFFTLYINRNSRWWNVIGFILSAAAAVYATYISVLPVLLISAYGVLTRRGDDWRGLRTWLFTLLGTALLLVPLVIFILPLVFSRLENLAQPPPQLFFGELISIFRIWFGPGFEVVILLGVFAIGAMFWKRSYNRLIRLALVWGVLSLPLMYLLQFFFGFFAQKYMSWILIGIAVFLGVQISRLPWKIQVLPFLCGFVLLSQTFPWLEVYSKWLAYRLEENMRWLVSENYQGDVVLFAHDHECFSPHSHFDLNMNMHITFPQGLNIVDSVNGQPRIWFVTADGSPNSPHWEALRRDYVERHFVGPPGCLFRLYERPPDSEGVQFSNGMRFHGAQFLRDGKALPPGFSPQLHEGESFQVRMWWQVEGPLPQDYSVGTFLMDAEGRVIEEIHGPPDPSYPEEAPWETSRWQVGQIYYEDREMAVPYPMERQKLLLRMALYYWEEPGVRFTAEGVDALGMLPVMQITIDSW